MAKVPIDNLPAHLSEAERTHITDCYFSTNISKEVHVNTIFTRVSAKEITFKNIDFKYTTFSDCYFRKCKFIDCDFTGCQFLDSNFRGSTFSACTFDYAIFSKTFVGSEILESSCPSRENLQRKFARSLRLNYQGLGNPDGANKAIKIELEATKIHLWKSWHWDSKCSYYRSEYKGLRRIEMFLKWLRFKTLDLIWGNGESAWKLLLTVVLTTLLMAVLHVFRTEGQGLIESYGYMYQVLLGTVSPQSYSGSYLAVIFVVRLMIFGFFMAILIKRFNRR